MDTEAPRRRRKVKVAGKKVRKKVRDPADEGSDRFQEEKQAHTNGSVETLIEIE